MDLRILIVEDNNDHAMVLQKCLEFNTEPHYIVERVMTLKATIERLKISKEASILLDTAKKTSNETEIKRLQDLILEGVILDLTLPDSSNNKLDDVARVADASKHVGIVVYTGWGDREFEQNVIEAGADALLHKGAATPHDISRELQFAILQKRQEKEEHKLEETLRRIGRIVDKIGSFHD